MMVKTKMAAQIHSFLQFHDEQNIFSRPQIDTLEQQNDRLQRAIK